MNQTGYTGAPTEDRGRQNTDPLFLGRSTFRKGVPPFKTRRSSKVANHRAHRNIQHIGVVLARFGQNTRNRQEPLP